MEFTVADRESNTWQKLKEHYEDRLKKLREKNDYPMTDTLRNILIGQIQEVKALLGLEKPGITIKE